MSEKGPSDKEKRVTEELAKVSTDIMRNYHHVKGSKAGSEQDVWITKEMNSDEFNNLTDKASRTGMSMDEKEEILEKMKALRDRLEEESHQFDDSGKRRRLN